MVSETNWHKTSPEVYAVFSVCRNNFNQKEVVIYAQNSCSTFACHILIQTVATFATRC